MCSHLLRNRLYHIRSNRVSAESGRFPQEARLVVSVLWPYDVQYRSKCVWVCSATLATGRRSLWVAVITYCYDLRAFVVIIITTFCPITDVKVVRVDCGFQNSIWNAFEYRSWVSCSYILSDSPWFIDGHQNDYNCSLYTWQRIR